MSQNVTQIIGQILNSTFYRNQECSNQTDCPSSFSNMEFVEEYTKGYLTKELLIYIVVLAVLYCLYLWRFKGYGYIDKERPQGKQKNIGEPLPVFPNGWYAACRFDEIKNGEAKSIDIAGENLVVFKSTKGEVYALQAYCKHMGANLGIGGKVINNKCVQCPFHGWLYDGQTGNCVDFDGRPLKGKSVEYNKEMCQEGGKHEWKQYPAEEMKLRKYPTCIVSSLVFVWVHAVKAKQDKPEYEFFCVEDFKREMKIDYRGYTYHEIKSHLMDIPENGADTLHFKFVHKQMFPFLTQLVTLSWTPKWILATDPKLEEEMFTHSNKGVHKWKRTIWEKYVKNYPSKEHLSIGNVEIILKLPFLKGITIGNITIFQLGPTFVYIFVKMRTHEMLYVQYHQPHGIYETNLTHQLYVSWWVPYWLTALFCYVEGVQVTSDMKVWNNKKFARKLYYREGLQSDAYIVKWRKWYSQYYEGTEERDKEIMGRFRDYSW